MKKIPNKVKMAIVVILAIGLSAYVLQHWSAGSSITIGMVLVSLLIHVAVPSFLAWTIIYKKLFA